MSARVSAVCLAVLLAAPSGGAHDRADKDKLKGT